MSEEVVDLLRAILTTLQRIESNASAPDHDDAETLPDERLELLATLEEYFQGEYPGDRARAIQERMHISRATYYRLRRQLIESHSLTLGDETAG